MEKEFLSINDVSEYLGMKRSTLYLKVEKHQVPFYRFGRLIRFKKVDLDRWAEGFRYGGNRFKSQGTEAPGKCSHG